MDEFDINCSNICFTKLIQLHPVLGSLQPHDDFASSDCIVGGLSFSTIGLPENISRLQGGENKDGTCICTSMFLVPANKKKKDPYRWHNTLSPYRGIILVCVVTYGDGGCRF